jgi:hypothetical protein
MSPFTAYVSLPAGTQLSPATKSWVVSEDPTTSTEARLSMSEDTPGVNQAAGQQGGANICPTSTTPLPVGSPSGSPVNPTTNIPLDPPPDSPINPPTNSSDNPPADSPLNPPANAPLNPSTDSPIDPPDDPPTKETGKDAGSKHGKDDKTEKTKPSRASLRLQNANASGQATKAPQPSTAPTRRKGKRTPNVTASPASARDMSPHLSDDSEEASSDDGVASLFEYDRILSCTPDDLAQLNGDIALKLEAEEVRPSRFTRSLH